MNSLEKAKKIADFLDNKKGKDITILDISHVTNIGDYFVIASGSSTPQINALVDEVEDKMREAGEKVGHIEGYNTATWVLMDYGDVLAHIFHEETRDFYGIERLWTDAGKIDFQETSKQEGEK